MVDVSKNDLKKLFAKKSLFLEFKMKIHLEKLVLILKDHLMKFISNIKPYFINTLFRHNTSLRFENFLIFQRLRKIFLTQNFLGTEVWKVLKQFMKKAVFSKFQPGPITVTVTINYDFRLYCDLYVVRNTTY